MPCLLEQSCLDDVQLRPTVFDTGFTYVMEPIKTVPKRKRMSQIFHPFVSLENTELTVHQIRAMLES